MLVLCVSILVIFSELGQADRSQREVLFPALEVRTRAPLGDPQAGSSLVSQDLHGPANLGDGA